MSVEVCKFLRRFGLIKKLIDGSKQAFSQARKRIKWEGYKHLNNIFVQRYYSDNELEKYKGKYVLIGVDGTTYELPYEQGLIDYFGVHDNGFDRPICMARGLKLYDLLNDVNLVALIEPYVSATDKGQSERACFEKSLEEFTAIINTSEYSNEKIADMHDFLFVGDKYYPSIYNFYTLEERDHYYVLRCRTNFCKEVTEFCKSDQNDAWITIDLGIKHRKYINSVKRLAQKGAHPKAIKVRVIKKTLHNGEQLCLITNVSDLSHQEICEVYDKRWNEEVSFDTDKNKLEVENFSSITPDGIHHDFHATILTANIAQLVISEAQLRVDKQQAKKNNKHPYKINRAVAIGLIKDEIPLFLLGQQKSETWLEDMTVIVAQHKEPVRNNRSYKKKVKHKLKYPITKRRTT